MDEYKLGPSPLRPSQENRILSNPVSLIPYRRILVSSIGDTSSSIENIGTLASIYYALPYTNSWVFQDGIDRVYGTEDIIGDTNGGAHLRFTPQHCKVGNKFEIFAWGQITSHTAANPSFVIDTRVRTKSITTPDTTSTAVANSDGFSLGGSADLYKFWQTKSIFQIRQNQLSLFSVSSVAPADGSALINYSGATETEVWTDSRFFEVVMYLGWSAATTDNAANIQTNYIELLKA